MADLICFGKKAMYSKHIIISITNPKRPVVPVFDERLYPFRLHVQYIRFLPSQPYGVLIDR